MDIQELKIDQSTEDSGSSPTIDAFQILNKLCSQISTLNKMAFKARKTEWQEPTVPAAGIRGLPTYAIWYSLHFVLSLGPDVDVDARRSEGA